METDFKIILECDEYGNHSIEYYTNGKLTHIDNYEYLSIRCQDDYNKIIAIFKEGV